MSVKYRIIHENEKPTTVKVINNSEEKIVKKKLRHLLDIFKPIQAQKQVSRKR